MLSIGQILAFTAAALATFIAGAGSAKGVASPAKPLPAFPPRTPRSTPS